MGKVSSKQFPLPVLKFDHFYRLTDETGILEHSYFAIPDKSHGYTTDDNARALQVCLRLGDRIPNREKLIDTYLKFLILAKKDNGFFNDLKPDLQWENCPNPLGEHFGRAMSALGETAVNDPDTNRKLCAVSLFDQMSMLISPSLDLRTCANLISGLYYRFVFSRFSTNQPKIKEITKLLADRLVTETQKNLDKAWQWFEDKITYDNPRLPLGLLYANKITGEGKYLEIALKTFDFLLETTFNSQKDCFYFIGNRGWLSKNGQKNLFDQQPIEAGSTVEACCSAYQITKQEKYLDFAKKAFLWYSGKNILGLSLIDEESGGIKDGLETYGINQNQGAESILGYLLAYHSLEETIQK